MTYPWVAFSIGLAMGAASLVRHHSPRALAAWLRWDSLPEDILKPEPEGHISHPSTQTNDAGYRPGCISWLTPINLIGGGDE